MTPAQPQQPQHLAELDRIMASIRYKSGWSIRLGGPARAYLCATSLNPNSTPPHDPIRTGHMFALPRHLLLGDPRDLAVRRALIRWVFAQLLLAEQHEAGEWFSWEGRRVYFPGHQGDNPYTIRECWTGTSAIGPSPEL